jgi:hypothetical protein
MYTGDDSPVTRLFEKEGREKMRSEESKSVQDGRLGETMNDVFTATRAVFTMGYVGFVSGVVESGPLWSNGLCTSSSGRDALTTSAGLSIGGPTYGLSTVQVVSRTSSGRQASCD